MIDPPSAAHMDLAPSEHPHSFNAAFTPACHTMVLSDAKPGT